MKKKVVVIGGGFVGAMVSRKLEKKFQVVLIDTKDYFEFTPSILRTIVKPKHMRKIQVLHKHYLHRARVIHGSVKEISDGKVKVDVAVSGLHKKKSFDYDYLVIASGSSYSLPIKESNLVISTRANNLRDSYDKLCRAREVLIIGGGLVGIELAGEILDHYDDKKIKIVHSRNHLIPRNNRKAIKYAEKFLEKRGVEIVFGERIEKNSKGVFVTDKKRKLKPDVAFLCTGIRPNFEFMKKNFGKALNEGNQIEVNSFLQMKNGKDLDKNIFVGGDIASVKEEKTAQNAEKHADIIVKNICRLDSGKKLCKYSPEKRFMVISLGMYDGILTKGNFSLGGWIPAFLKKFVEWKTMEKYR